MTRIPLPHSTNAEPHENKKRSPEATTKTSYPYLREIASCVKLLSEEPPTVKILLYIEFGVQVASVIPGIIALAKANAITPASLLAEVQPVAASLQATFNVTIPSQLVSDITTAVADAIIAFHKKAQ